MPFWQGGSKTWWKKATAVDILGISEKSGLTLQILVCLKIGSILNRSEF